jgi:hypothetical protein
MTLLPASFMVTRHDLRPIFTSVAGIFTSVAGDLYLGGGRAHPMRE